MQMRASRYGLALALFVGMVGHIEAADLVIGQSAPLSGVLADTGHDLVQGVQVYFSSVNDHGGVNGNHIKLVVRDDGYKVDETIKATDALINQDHAVALIGYAGTANVGELLKRGTLAKAGIPLVGPLTGAAVLREPPNNNVFHIRAGYADEMEYMVNQLFTLAVKDIGVVYQNDAFGKAGLDGVIQAMQRRGLKPAVTASYERNTSDISGAVRTVLAAKPSAVILVSVSASTAAFAKSYHELGGTGQLFNISVVDSNELVRLAGLKNIVGLAITQVVPYPFTAFEPIVREYQEAMKHYAPQARLSYISLESFIAAKVLTEGLRHAGSNPTPRDVTRALENLGTYDTGGFSVTFSPQSHIGSRFVDMTIVGHDGRLFH